MTNFTQKQKSDNEFMSSFSAEVREYIGIQDGFSSNDSARWLLDSHLLKQSNWSNGYGDYSFIVVPAAKGLEYWIFKIAEDLGVEVNTNKAGVVRSQIESELEDALDSIEGKIQQSIQIDVNQLRNIWQEYRNDVVHCQKKIESPAQAGSKVTVIYDRINTVTQKLIDADLIPVE